MFFCKKCGKSFPDIRETAEHENICIEPSKTGSQSTTHTCKHCGKRFDRSFNCRRHQTSCAKRVAKSQQTTCDICNKNFQSFPARKLHESACIKLPNQHRCHKCGESFDSISKLARHESDSGHNSPGTSGLNSKTEKVLQEEKKVKCSICKCVFTNRKALYQHRVLEHKQTSSVINSLQSVPWTDKPVWEDDEGNINNELKRTYEHHKHLILRANDLNRDDIKSSYNFPLFEQFSTDDLMSCVENVYENEHVAFKINLSFGIILQHANTGEFRYFVPYYNQNVLERPFLISNREGLEKLREKLSRLDVTSYILKQRENTAWKPRCVTNVVIEIYRSAFPLGNTPSSLPNRIKAKKSIISFERHPRTNKIYDDFLCFFRCLAYHIKGSIYIERLSKKLFSKWESYVFKHRLKSNDVTLNSMPDLEKCFGINIHVYSLTDKKSALARYKSLERITDARNRKDIMFLDLHEQHLSYIKSFKAYSEKFECSICSMLFRLHFKCKVHERTCKNKTKIKLPGGYYSLPKSIFDKLDEYGISIDERNREYPWYITYDFESMLIKESNEGVFEKWNTTHKPVSVSICSNVEGFEEPYFILDDNLDSLLSQMISHMKQISGKAYTLAKEKWEEVSSRLDELEQQWGVGGLKRNGKNNSHSCEKDNENSEESDYYEGEEARETNECEPASEEFLKAINKENVYYSMLKRLEKTNELKATYNNWNTDSDIVDDNDDDDDDDDDDVASCTSDTSSISSKGGETIERNVDCSDDDDCILPFRALNSRRIVSDDDDDDDDDDDADSCITTVGLNDQIEYELVNSSQLTQELMIKQLNGIRNEFEEFCQQIPCLGFNSAKYDLNLIKEKLAKHLNLHSKNSGKKFIVKKSNAYMCIANGFLRFLDMMAYLPPATSYDKFLETFKIKTRKAYFPYEFFTSMEVLEQTYLPPKESFYSTLKQRNILENDLFISYSELRKQGKTKEQAFELLRLTPDAGEPSSSIDDKYNELITLWKTKNFVTMKDYLQYYNNLDSFPFVEAIKAFKEFFTKKNIDVFKDCISIPGVARKMLFEAGIKNGAIFSLIDPSDSELYKKMKNGIVGGPSIIFNRHQKSDETCIREDKSKPCKSILGLDFNSLYLHSIMQPMCVGNYIRRKQEHCFKPLLKNRRYTSMFHWMDWLSSTRQIDIKHKQNNGKELRVGPYLIDGFENGTNNLFEFLGCWWHGHDCEYIKKKLDEKVRQERFQKHTAKMKFLHDNGFHIQSVWECQYHAEMKTNKTLEAFVRNRNLPFHKKFPREVDVDEILNGVVDETLFGFVEVSIEVPDTFEKSMFKPPTSLAPRQYFSEMSPIFCTTKIPIDCIGEYMKSIVEENNISKKPRTLLVGGMKAEKIFLATPLLKWYLEHGLMVTEIFEVVEYSKMDCFKEFGEGITTARREGDVDSSLEIIGTLNKLLGNSAFGGTIMDQQKFSKITYVKGFKEACFAVNNKRFKNLTELEDDIFETEFFHSTITINTAVQVGNMILQYSKLRLLQFYYDWLDINVDRRDFELTECDTDSLYMALSEKSLDDVVKPELKSKYFKMISDISVCQDGFVKNTWFTRKCCEKHTKYDSRTPGLMKVEFHGDEMISLCSKSYIAKSDKCIKYSMKGVNKTFIDPFPMYQSVLKTCTNISGVNRGFRVFENKVRTYEQTKTALNYFYCKRKVASDGIHTEPLELTLKPIQRGEGENEWM